MSGDALSQLGIPSPFERGFQLARKVLKQFGPSLVHDIDGKAHVAPVEGCDLCERAVSIRVGLQNGEPIDDELAALVDLIQQTRTSDVDGTRPQPWQKEKAARLADLLWSGPHTIEELVEGSGLSRASVFRYMAKLGAVKVSGGSGRTPGRFQCKVTGGELAVIAGVDQVGEVR